MGRMSRIDVSGCKDRGQGTIYANCYKYIFVRVHDSRHNVRESCSGLKMCQGALQRAGYNILLIVINIQGWPEPYIYGVYTVFLAGKSPNIRSYTVYTYGSGQPYKYIFVRVHGSRHDVKETCPGSWVIAASGCARQRCKRHHGINYRGNKLGCHGNKLGTMVNKLSAKRNCRSLVLLYPFILCKEWPEPCMYIRHKMLPAGIFWNKTQGRIRQVQHFWPSLVMRWGKFPHSFPLKHIDQSLTYARSIRHQYSKAAACFQVRLLRSYCLRLRLAYCTSYALHDHAISMYQHRAAAASFFVPRLL